MGKLSQVTLILPASDVQRRGEIVNLQTSSGFSVVFYAKLYYINGQVEELNRNSIYLVFGCTLGVVLLGIGAATYL
jgi:hypothetical protein